MVPETTPENFSSVGILCPALQRFQIRVKINFSNANYLAIRAPTELNFFQVASGTITMIWQQNGCNWTVFLIQPQIVQYTNSGVFQFSILIFTSLDSIWFMDFKNVCHLTITFFFKISLREYLCKSEMDYQILLAIFQRSFIQRTICSRTLRYRIMVCIE